MCFTVLQRTDKTGTESHKDIHSESLNSTQVIWLSISQQCQNRKTLHLLGKESKGMYMRMYFCAFFLPSSSIHLWLKRSIIPWKVLLTIVWLKEVIYVTVVLASSCLDSTRDPLTDNLFRHPKLGHVVPVWHCCLCP